jgi:formyl-CoA transferase
LHASIEAITDRHSSEEVSEALREAAIPHSPITPIENVADLPFVSSTALKTVSPSGKAVRLPPPAVMTTELERLERTLPFAPAYGEHTDALLSEIGFSDSEIADFRERGVVA